MPEVLGHNPDRELTPDTPELVELGSQCHNDLYDIVERMTKGEIDVEEAQRLSRERIAEEKAGLSTPIPAIEPVLDDLAAEEGKWGPPPSFEFPDQDPLNEGEEFELDFPHGVPIRKVSKLNPESGIVSDKFIPTPIQINGKLGRSINTSDHYIQNVIEFELPYMKKLKIRTRSASGKMKGRASFAYEIVLPVQQTGDQPPDVLPAPASGLKSAEPKTYNSVEEIAKEFIKPDAETPAIAIEFKDSDKNKPKSYEAFFPGTHFPVRLTNVDRVSRGSIRDYMDERQKGNDLRWRIRVVGKGTATDGTEYINAELQPFKVLVGTIDRGIAAEEGANDNGEAENHDLTVESLLDRLQPSQERVRINREAQKVSEDRTVKGKLPVVETLSGVVNTNPDEVQVLGPRVSSSELEHSPLPEAHPMSYHEIKKRAEALKGKETEIEFFFTKAPEGSHHPFTQRGETKWDGVPVHIRGLRKNAEVQEMVRKVVELQDTGHIVVLKVKGFQDQDMPVQRDENGRDIESRPTIVVNVLGYEDKGMRPEAKPLEISLESQSNTAEAKGSEIPGPNGMLAVSIPRFADSLPPQSDQEPSEAATQPEQQGTSGEITRLRNENAEFNNQRKALNDLATEAIKEHNIVFQDQRASQRLVYGMFIERMREHINHELRQSDYQSAANLATARTLIDTASRALLPATRGVTNRSKLDALDDLRATVDAEVQSRLVSEEDRTAVGTAPGVLNEPKKVDEPAVVSSSNPDSITPQAEQSLSEVDKEIDQYIEFSDELFGTADQPKEDRLVFGITHSLLKKDQNVPAEINAQHTHHLDLARQAINQTTPDRVEALKKLVNEIGTTIEGGLAANDNQEIELPDIEN